MAFVNLLSVVYPIGSIYFSTSSTSPATFVGGTWSRIYMDLNNSVKSLYTDGYFDAFQIGNIVFTTGFGSLPTMAAWEEKTAKSNMSLPGSAGAIGGTFYAQDTGKCVWATPNNGGLYFNNKNSAAINTNWYYGNMIYRISEASKYTNSSGYYIWKRTA